MTRTPVPWVITVLVWVGICAAPAAVLRFPLGPSLAAAAEVAASIPLVPPQSLRFPKLRFTPPEATRRSLSNGIVVYLLEDHELPLVNVRALVRVGASYEPDHVVGLAGLTGTVLRSGGTKTRPPEALNERLEFLAASLESGIGFDSGSVSLAVLTKDLDEGLEIFDDLLRHPAFPEDKLKLAKVQRLEGIRRQNDNPQAIAFREFRRLLYPNHPRGRSATVSSVSRVRRDDLVRFYQQYFYPRNLLLGVSGDFDTSKLLARLERTLGTWRDERRPAAPVSPPRGSPTASLSLFLKAVPQSTVVMGHLSVAKNHADFYPFTVLNYILGGGGFTSRLVSQVRTERGLAYSVASMYRGDIDYGVFAAYAQTKSQSTVEVIKLIRKIIEEITSAQISSDELQLARDAIVNKFIFSFSSPGQVVGQRMSLEFDGLPGDFLTTYRDRIAAVSLADLARVAKQYLFPKRSINLVVGNAPEFDPPLSSLGKVRTIEPPAKSAN